MRIGSCWAMIQIEDKQKYLLLKIISIITSELFLFLLRSSLSRSSLCRHHGNNFIVDNFILSLYLDKNFINFSLVLFINSWDDKHENPGHGEESEGVEDGSPC